MRRDPGEARFLGLWTAGWLAVWLLAGIIRFGDLSLQWPVLAVPLVWALVVARPRRSGALSRGDRPPPRGRYLDGDRYRDDRYRRRDPSGHGVPYGHGDPYGHGVPYGHGDPYPATREAPILPAVRPQRPRREG